MAKEYITLNELENSTIWKYKNRIPKNRILRLDDFEFDTILSKLKRCPNLYSLRLGAGLSILPSDLFELTQLEYLDLSDNKLKYLPKDIRNLQNLQMLDLSDNKLIALPEELCQCLSLQRLYLEENVLQALPSEISNLQNLHTIYLSENLLTALPDSFAEMSQLKEVALVNNLITEINGDYSNWKRLKYFYISGNPLLLPPSSIPRISLTIKEVNSLASYLLNNSSLKEINIYDANKFASTEEIINELVPEFRNNDKVQISDW